MTYRLPICLLLLGAALPLQAGDIDLRCEELSNRLIARLADEGLLASSAENVRQRARTIGVESCTGAQANAEQQHEQAKKQALDNWFFQDRGDKPGNKRLRELKQ